MRQHDTIAHEMRHAAGSAEPAPLEANRQPVHSMRHARRPAPGAIFTLPIHLAHPSCHVPSRRVSKSMRARPALPPASRTSALVAVLVRMALAYVLVVQGLTGAMASARAASLGDAMPVLCLSGSDDPQDGTPRPHDMSCCFSGCMAGGGLFIPPEHADLLPPWRGAVVLHQRLAGEQALPRTPTSSFQARAPPVAV